jgi:glycosyltransferase involved in cell wall biosynthesis
MPNKLTHTGSDRVPLVSVIIPTLDRPEFLQAALRSVLRQTIADFEVLVIDDGSATDLLPFLNALDDGRIRYFRHESTRGEAAARNTGLLNARGAYLAFLDDDDQWLPDKLSRQLELFRQTSDRVGWVYGGYVMVRAEDGQVLSYRLPTERGDLSRELLQRNLPGNIPSTTMLKRECIERVGLFDEDIAYGVDHDLGIRIAQEYHFDFVPDVVARYAVHERQMSRDAFCVARGHADLLQKYGERYRRDRPAQGRIHFNLGRQMCLRGQAAKGRRAFLEAIRRHPPAPRPYVYLALSLAGPTGVMRFQALMAKLRRAKPADTSRAEARRLSRRSDASHSSVQGDDLGLPARSATGHGEPTAGAPEAAPLVTVVIPTHNYAGYVVQAIRSARDQGYRPIEIIVVDDGSTDETPAVLQEFEATIRVLRLDGVGVSAARNAGLAQARGEYVIFLDADDLLLPGSVAAQVVRLAGRPDVHAAVGEWYDCDMESGTVTHRRGFLENGDVLSRLLRSNLIATPSAVMLRRATLGSVGGFDTSLSFTADWELWLRLAKHGCRFAQVTGPVAVYRIHRRSMTRNLDLVIRDTTAFLDRWLNDPALPGWMRTVEPETRRDVMLYLVRLCLREGDEQRAGDCLRQAVARVPDVLDTLAFYRRLAEATSRNGRLDGRSVLNEMVSMLTGVSDLDRGGEERRRRRRALGHLAAGMTMRDAGDWERSLRHLGAAVTESWRDVLLQPQLGCTIRLLLPRWLTRSARTALSAVGWGSADDPRGPGIESFKLLTSVGVASRNPVESA